MHTSIKVAALLFLAVGLSSGVARADERQAPDSATRAAGWAVIGIGSSLGVGSAVTGVVMMANHGTSSEERVGIATLAGGVATLVIAFAIGMPLASSSTGGKAERSSGEALVRALSGEIRF